MEVRKQVRRRRRERIEQLIGKFPYSGREAAGVLPPGERPAPQAPPSESEAWEAYNGPAGPLDSLAGMDDLLAGGARPSRRSASPRQQHPAPQRAAPPPERLRQERQEPDPEKWWKERQRMGFAAPDGGPGLNRPEPGTGRPPEGRGERTGPIGSLSDFGPYRGLSGASGWDDGPIDRPPFGERLLRGLALRTCLALAVFAAVWGWMRSDWPGSGEAKALAVRSLTQDMDFAAVEAWYERTFGDSPAFLPMFRRQQPSQAAIAEWSRDQTVPPLDGRIVQTFAQNGDGVRIAAPAGTAVKAVHSGRVTKVATDEAGVATVWVQHPNRIVTEYGNVESPEVKPNDWVEAGQALGELASTNPEDGGEDVLFFAVMQDGKAIDPTDVVPFA